MVGDCFPKLEILVGYLICEWGIIRHIVGRRRMILINVYMSGTFTG